MDYISYQEKENWHVTHDYKREREREKYSSNLWIIISVEEEKKSNSIHLCEIIDMNMSIRCYIYEWSFNNPIFLYNI